MYKKTVDHFKLYLYYELTHSINVTTHDNIGAE